ncbi:MAG TPA: 4'-phosphopantetheinyl transferase superfamily protein [Methanotrichaceae archaeon]|nr:4'-phosphopantetheinyl transferase superfamily protein [Methanotrichaceae archaeon]
MKDNRSWCRPPEHVTLGRNEVHIWSTSLNLPEGYLSQLAQTLSEDELLRAEHLRFEKDKKWFIAGRGVLRQILGRYLCIEPGQLQFCYGPHGKPYLTAEFGGDELRFSLAHSNDLAIYAVTLSREIGVDLEYSRILPDAEEIAARLFSIRENAAWLRLPAEKKQDAFYVCWTCREAYVKALGSGLAQPLGEPDESLRLLEPGWLSHAAHDPVEAARWSLKVLVPAPGYIGALAMAGGECHLRCYQWSPA